MPMYIWTSCGSVNVMFYKRRQIRYFNSQSMSDGFVVLVRTRTSVRVSPVALLVLFFPNRWVARFSLTLNSEHSVSIFVGFLCFIFFWGRVYGILKSSCFCTVV